MPVFVKNLRVISFLGLFPLLSIPLLSDAEGIWAGKVVYAPDKLFAVSADHSERSIQRGSLFFQGDTLKTTGFSRVQLRFLDNTVMVLRPETEFRIDAFSYTEATDMQVQNEVLAFRGTLLKGSLRTITGDIGNKTPDAYFLNTPVATIFQVQGANYELVLGNAGLAVAVWDGTLTIENEAGSIVLGGDSDFSYALITEYKALPQGLSSPPDLAVLNDHIQEETKSGQVDVDAGIDPGVDGNTDKQEQKN